MLAVRNTMFHEGSFHVPLGEYMPRRLNSSRVTSISMANPEFIKQSISHIGEEEKMEEVIGLQTADAAKARPAPTGFEGDSNIHNAVRGLINTYHDLNPTMIDELHDEPSPLEFMRYVSRNRPFVVRRGADSFAARKKWNANYLGAVMKDQQVNVAQTLLGNADSIVDLGESKLLFVKPYETQLPFQEVMQTIQKQEFEREEFQGLTCYAQTQNDNLRDEYISLFDDVPKSIPFARVALEKEPDAINFWLGNSSSVTALHKDNYENIYVQILGKKHFVLLPPVESPCVNEMGVLAASYRPKDAGADSKLCIHIDEPAEYVPFATWDPDVPTNRATVFSHLSRPLRVTLNEGDMLYLPALWYHKVSQSCSAEGICCAVNYWYDLEFSGSFWTTSTFVRAVGLLGSHPQNDGAV